MARCSAIPGSSHPLRSVSMPSRLQPIVLRVEEELKRLKTQEIPLLPPTSSATAEMVSDGLGGLQELYSYIEDLLRLPLIQQALIHQCHNKLVEEELEKSIKLLDLCGAAKDLLLALKESMLDLKSVLRRRGDSAVGESIAAYIHSRKKAQKDIYKCLGGLKKLKTNCISCPLHDQGCELSMVFKVLSETRAITASLFSSTFSLCAVSLHFQQKLC